MGITMVFLPRELGGNPYGPIVKYIHLVHLVQHLQVPQVCHPIPGDGMEKLT